MDAEAFEALAAEFQEGFLPKWILENQQLGWTGSWEATSLDDERSWAENLWEEKPPPFEALKDDGRSKQRFSSAALHPRRLRRLLYTSPEAGRPGLPLGACCSCPSQQTRFSQLYGPKVDSITDDEGWTYASSFDSMQEKRLGGRAMFRYGDTVRQRRWLRGAEIEALPGRGYWCSEATRQVFGSFSNAVSKVVSQRSITRWPLDPTALLRRGQKDRERYQELCGRLPPWREMSSVTELLLGALYSRAAYGHTGRMGLFDSVSAAAPVFTVQRAAFDYAEHVDDDSNDLAFLDMMGLSREDLVARSWRASGPLEPVYAVARDHSLRWIVVAVRGTLSNKDIMTDSAAHCVNFLEGTAHEGFVHTSEKLLQRIEQTLREETETSGYRLVFCGHSMGGALSAMCVASLRAKAASDPHSFGMWAASCCAYCIGTPGTLCRSIGERLKCEHAVVTAVNELDWSPRSSVNSLDELFDDLCDLSYAGTALRNAIGDSPRSMPPTEVSADLEQLPPGLILQIARSRETPLLRAEPRDYRHSFPAFPDIDAHIPLRYIEGLVGGIAAMSRARARCSRLSQGDGDGDVFSALRMLLEEEGAPARAAPELAEPRRGPPTWMPCCRRAQKAQRPGPGTPCVLDALQRLCLRQSKASGHQPGMPAHLDRARELVTELMAA